MKNDKKDPIKTVLNWNTGDVEYEFSGGVILGRNGRTKIKVTDNVAIDVDSGEPEIIEPFFGGDNGDED